MATGDPRLRRIDETLLADPWRPLCVSAVVAFEFADLQKRQRIAVTEPFSLLQSAMDLTILDLPADCWRVAADLPAIHRDRVDRLLIAHALTSGMTLVTADRAIRRYPVRFA